MRVVCIAAILALAVCAVSPILSAQRVPVGPIPIDCNRACLEGLINQYLDAVSAHDPKGLPLSADVKYTEQEQIMAVGDGFWKTVTEAFRIENNQIRRVEMIGTGVPYHFNSSWGTGLSGK